MGGGEILEQGSHNELLESQGTYSQLIAAQQLAAATKKTDTDSDEGHTLNADADGAEPVDKEAIEAQLVAEKQQPALARMNTGKSSLSSQILKDKTTGSNTAGYDTISYRTIAVRFWK